jgi:3-(3-hydroxy-phenyl)propionate hydroxylase
LLVFDVILKRQVDLPDYTVQHCDPARPMTACYVTDTRRRWEIMLLPGEDPAVIARPENVWPLVAKWVTPADADLERAAVYTFHSVIAEGWRRGRLLLAGDAAHQTPPFLGQGMCAGIRDVANLAWKLVLVVRGLADDALLDTYESERKPHVHAFIDLAVRLGDIIQTTDPAVAAERDRKFRDSEPEIFVYPTPMLGEGVHSGAAPAGSVFGQPVLGDGRLLDAAVGLNFAVIGERALLDAANEATRARWRNLSASVLGDPGGELGEWLRANQARALVLRPDRYIVGIANDVAALERLSAALPAPPPVPAASAA